MKIKEIVWNDSSKKAFLDYLVTHGNYEKQAWTRKILNTQLDVLAVPTKTMHTMASEIYRGDYAAFLSLKLYDCYECIALNGMIISKIKDFDEMVGYLKEYTKVMENWAHCDLLTFTIAAENEARFRELAVEFIQSTRVFERRLGLFIHLHLIRNPTYVEAAFDVLTMLEDEEAYYVIMMAGWLLSECIIRYQEASLEKLNVLSINPKIVNKGIQKCRESRRVSEEVKTLLLDYKEKLKNGIK